jgi:hypothetical protein
MQRTLLVSDELNQKNSIRFNSLVTLKSTKKAHNEKECHRTGKACGGLRRKNRSLPIVKKFLPTASQKSPLADRKKILPTASQSSLLESDSNLGGGKRFTTKYSKIKKELGLFLLTPL